VGYALSELSRKTGESIRLSDSGGPGFVFLTIADTSQLSGKIIFVQRAVGITSSGFALTVE
jgi:hypothetical protein